MSSLSGSQQERRHQGLCDGEGLEDTCLWEPAHLDLLLALLPALPLHSKSLQPSAVGPAGHLAVVDMYAVAQL
eukprot:CAMPEP_0115339306 /NCGR_PEP_ID=MMETSP0270-20121206/90543_1 /TAXON_ID=71861 /ORGANISM="Scrippsiella trochoidea, Strain CCMP3099" /LENGTH=72 /DNA_ID=CAMNT_0002760685 /DNA_START=93 /DNA_END=311 /DNA_ORIENTATION=+